MLDDMVPGHGRSLLLADKPPNPTLHAKPALDCAEESGHGYYPSSCRGPQKTERRHAYKFKLLFVHTLWSTTATKTWLKTVEEDQKIYVASYLYILISRSNCEIRFVESHLCVERHGETSPLLRLGAVHIAGTPLEQWFAGDDKLHMTGNFRQCDQNRESRHGGPAAMRP
ncbi:hypothetical protein BKA67DRAFT_649191 [Truncatella angustata]|uniref:Uncharacterized protein n=1 Tax=Truncatella angustata TaxID=152316 RepID=A0A9P8UDG1_9PEZI|nr:uncharacterized protein BKA67DRAFT_649191 [Truncatella angustata]KAH6647439.1 hypothetical protein BKA67DRAFT_649191 [Truncatella angustata]